MTKQTKTKTNPGTHLSFYLLVWASKSSREPLIVGFAAASSLVLIVKNASLNSVKISLQIYNLLVLVATVENELC